MSITTNLALGVAGGSSAACVRTAAGPLTTVPGISLLRSSSMGLVAGGCATSRAIRQRPVGRRAGLHHCQHYWNFVQQASYAHQRYQQSENDDTKKVSDLLREVAFKLVDLECVMRDIVSLLLTALVFTIAATGIWTLHIPFRSFVAYASFAFVWRADDPLKKAAAETDRLLSAVQDLRSYHPECPHNAIVGEFKALVGSEVPLLFKRYYPEILPESFSLLHIKGRNLFWAAMKMAAKEFYIDGIWLPISSCLQ